MKVSRYPLAHFPRDTVQQMVGDCFFASPGFAEVWRTKGGRPVVWAVEVDGATAAILPGVEFGRGLLTRFQSMPDGCYGGVFYARDLGSEKDRLARALLEAVARHRYLKSYLFDFYATLPRNSHFEMKEYETTLVEISGREWEPPDKKLVSQVRKAEREGIQMEAFDWGRHHAGFLTLMRASERRHGREPVYRARFFEALADLARREERIHWVWCEHEGKPACSHIYFIENGVLQGWQIYFDKAFSFLKPNQYIRFTMCREMAKLGVTRLNLGGSPENAPGLTYYKKRWGGQRCLYNGYVLKRGLGKLL